MAAVELDDKWYPQHMRLDCIEDVKGATLANWATTAMDAGVNLISRNTKYRARHLAEAQYQINRRFELHTLVDRLLWSCVRAAPCSEP